MSYKIPDGVLTATTMAMRSTLARTLAGNISADSKGENPDELLGIAAAHLAAQGAVSRRMGRVAFAEMMSHLWDLHDEERGRAR